MTKTPNQITSEVDKSVEQYTEQNLPFIGVINLETKRALNAVVNYRNAKFLGVISSWHEHRGKKLTAKHKKAQERLSGVLGTNGSIPINPHVLASRQNTLGARRAQRRVNNLERRITEHEQAIVDMEDSVDLDRSNRNRAIEEERGELIKCKKDALARKGLRHQLLNMTDPRTGKKLYSRRDVKIILEHTSVGTFNEYSDESINVSALMATQDHNNLSLSGANRTVDSLNRNIKSLQDKITNNNTEQTNINTGILDMFALGTTSWDDASIDSLVNSLQATGLPLDSLKAIQLNELRAQYHSITRNITDLQRKEAGLKLELRRARRNLTDITTEHAQKATLLETRLKKARKDLATLAIEIARGA